MNLASWSLIPVRFSMKAMTRTMETAGRSRGLMRSLITLVPGRPAVLVNCHPVKNASPDNLLPAGGGNFLNQVDGNLTAAKTEGTTALHSQGKFRGVEFAPMYFLIKTGNPPGAEGE